MIVARRLFLDVNKIIRGLLVDHWRAQYIDIGLFDILRVSEVREKDRRMTGEHGEELRAAGVESEWEQLSGAREPPEPSPRGFSRPLLVYRQDQADRSVRSVSMNCERVQRSKSDRESIQARLRVVKDAHLTSLVEPSFCGANLDQNQIRSRKVS